MKDKELHELLDKEQWSDIIEKQSRQVRWLYNNSNKCTQVVDEKRRQEISDRSTKIMEHMVGSNPSTIYSSGRHGTITIGGKTIYARSSWEANIAAYLEFLKSQKEISEWEYEPETFWFLEIKRGVRSYKPDFKITNNDSSNYFIEVKGYMDAKSKTKHARMKIYYPNIRIEVLDEVRYKAIKKNKAIIPGWGMLDSDEFKASIVRCSIDGCENKNWCKTLCKSHFVKVYGNTKRKT